MSMLPGALLGDEQWLSERVEQTARQWGCPERRTNGTLWWYSASAVLLGPAVRELVVFGTAAGLDLETVRFAVRGNGYLERVMPGPVLSEPGPAALGRHLDGALGRVIEPLARTCGATERSLWAIAADSLATVLVNSGPEIAGAVATGSAKLRPLPRFVRVDPGNGGAVSTYVRRGSCCLLVRVPDGKCISCPNQTPAERNARLVRHARQRNWE